MPKLRLLFLETRLGGYNESSGLEIIGTQILPAAIIYKDKSLQLKNQASKYTRRTF